MALLKANRYTKQPVVDFSKIWLTFLFKAVLVASLAGMGWERLSAVETAIRSVQETRFEQRLAVIEAKIDLLLSRRIKPP